MKGPHALFCCLLLIAQVCRAEVSESKEDADSSVKRIGTYDSRAIAVAFVGSEIYRATAGKKMAEVMTELRKAESEGDQEQIRELKDWGKARQELRHRQGFSTAPVDDILAHISKKLPGIRKRTGVDLLVSKWDAKTLAKYKSAEQIDVTMSLVDAFNPNERQKGRAISVQKHNPVPLEKMQKHEH